MKKLYIILAIFGLFLSCNSEDEGEEKKEADIKTAILGTWKVESVTNRDTYGCDVSGKETMTFSENDIVDVHVLSGNGNPCKYETTPIEYILNGKQITLKSNSEKETSSSEITEITDTKLVLTGISAGGVPIDKDKARVYTLTK